MEAGPPARLLEVPEKTLSGLRLWAMAARPRTLPAAIAPVLVGSAAANWWANDHCALHGFADSADICSFRWGAFIAALIGSIFIQIGTNLANDYSDAKRGADTADRLGPVRVTSAGLVAPKRVLYATWLAFGVAVVAGIYLATVAGLGDHRGRRRVDRGGRPLHGRPAALRLRGHGRAVRVPVLRPGRRQRLLLRAARAARLAAVLALDLGRAALDRDPGRQQHPRPRDRPPRRQAHARRPARARADQNPVRGLRRRRLRASSASASPPKGRRPRSSACSPRRWPGARCRPCSRGRTAPPSTAPSPAPGRCSRRSASWSRSAC